MIKNKTLKRRIIEISWKHKLAHIGSCITAVDIIEDIYQKKKPHEPFILSSGHAGLALYVVLEAHSCLIRENDSNRYQIDAEHLLEKHGIHPNRDLDSGNGIWCSTGSLGQGLPIAVGMALADKTRNVYCLISDGECAEGSIWECARIIEEREIFNIHVYLNFNGYGAYKETSADHVPRIFLEEVRWTQGDNTFPFLKGQDAHYHTMSEEEYNEAMEILK